MVGRIVLEKAAKHLTPTSLELGGKLTTLVTSDSANQVTANRITLGKFTNCGQVRRDWGTIIERANIFEKVKSSTRLHSRTT
jgi:aldehyde dehydrogenase (NAD+)